MTEPTDAEILDAADDFRSQYMHGGITFDEFDSIGFARAVLAKWGTPQPVEREPLTDGRIAEMMRETWGCASIAPRHAMGFARAIEAEVRKQDDALILQLVEAAALPSMKTEAMLRQRDEAITAGRARLEQP